MEVTPDLDVWQWLVRHPGWLLERYHVKCNKKTAFEECCGKSYQGEENQVRGGSSVRLAVSQVEGFDVKSGRVEQTRDLSVAFGLV